MKKQTGLLLSQLRALMKNCRYVNEPLQAYIIPSSDHHNNEYLRDCDKRRDFVSGFTGSSIGAAIVTEEYACLWTDGRYFLQASQELDENWTLMKEGIPSTPSPQSWLNSVLASGSRVGVDPWLLKYSAWNDFRSSLELEGHSLVPITTNLVDLLWHDKPTSLNNKIIPLPIKYTGRISSEKVEDVKEEMKEKKASLLVLTALDEIAWLLNVRGSDIAYNPVFFAYVAISSSTGVHLFVDASKITEEVTKHFDTEKIAVNIRPYDKIEDFVQNTVKEGSDKIWICKSAGYHLHSLVPDKQRISEVTPVCFMKAIKNDTETQGLINCHIRDAAALCCYFAWLEKAVPNMRVDEVTGADKLESFRQQQADYMGLSFSTISSSGPNGAIIHYHPMAETARQITTTQLYLCDSGGQYKDGTTDVTRTIHLGTPTDYERECFTRVLKGQIALATTVFPSLIKGNYLDAFARKCLWDVGLDYQHGTSHGIGHFLNVHEGPIGISWRAYPDDPGLQVGMFLSNEPGYYEDGKFGIRLENIVRIVKANTQHNFKERGFLTFDTVTLVPIQIKMIATELLTAEEIRYLDEYHGQCRNIVGELLREMGDQEGLAWLLKETVPIGSA